MNNLIEQAISKFHNAVGTQWCAIAKQLPGLCEASRLTEVARRELDEQIEFVEKERDSRCEQVDKQQQLLDSIVVACGSLGLQWSELPAHIKGLREQALSSSEERRDTRRRIESAEKLAAQANAAREDAEDSWRSAVHCELTEAKNERDAARAEHRASLERLAEGSGLVYWARKMIDAEIAKLPPQEPARTAEVDEDESAKFDFNTLQVFDGTKRPVPAPAPGGDLRALLNLAEAEWTGLGVQFEAGQQLLRAIVARIEGGK